MEAMAKTPILPTNDRDSPLTGEEPPTITNSSSIPQYQVLNASNLLEINRQQLSRWQQEQADPVITAGRLCRQLLPTSLQQTFSPVATQLTHIQQIGLHQNVGEGNINPVSLVNLQQQLQVGSQQQLASSIQRRDNVQREQLSQTMDGQQHGQTLSPVPAQLPSLFAASLQSQLQSAQGSQQVMIDPTPINPASALSMASIELDKQKEKVQNTMENKQVSQHHVLLTEDMQCKRAQSLFSSNSSHVKSAASKAFKDSSESSVYGSTQSIYEDFYSESSDSASNTGSRNTIDPEGSDLQIGGKQNSMHLLSETSTGGSEMILPLSWLNGKDACNNPLAVNCAVGGGSDTSESSGSQSRLSMARKPASINVKSVSKNSAESSEGSGVSLPLSKTSCLHACSLGAGSDEREQRTFSNSPDESSSNLKIHLNASSDSVDYSVFSQMEQQSSKRQEEVTNKEWNLLFPRLQTYFAINGNCRVPRNYKIDPVLAQWCARVRQDKSKLSDEQKHSLTELGFDWLEKPVVPAPCSWDEMFERIVEYKKKHGTCRVPTRNKEDPQLGRWVEKQRMQAKDTSIEQKKKLDDIGFVWSVYQNSWDTHFQQLVAYKKEHGHCRVPRHYAKNPRLGKWVDNQRSKIRKKRMEPERLRQLESIGFFVAKHT